MGTYLVAFMPDVKVGDIPLPLDEWGWRSEITTRKDGVHELRVEYEDTLENDVRNQVYYRDIQRILRNHE